MFAFSFLVTIVLILILITILYYKKFNDTFYVGISYNKLENELSASDTEVFNKIQSVKGEDGYSIDPILASNFNKILGLPDRDILTNNNFKKRKEEKEENDAEEKLNIYELVPLLWFYQNRLFEIYREYFNRVKCLEYYYNVFKTSRKIKKNEPLEWHKDTCDITLDLNKDIDTGDNTYIGMDAIKSSLRMGSFGN